ncbi:MAG: hypothetical protein HXN90_04320 [Prevotella pallens]|nr:hypothetical protein [Prevotella pallens]
MCKYSFGYGNMHLGLRKYTVLVTQGYGHDESAPTPGGMFATNFVGERNIINNPSAALSQTVSSRRGPIYRARIYENTHEMANGYVRVIK